MSFATRRMMRLREIHQHNLETIKKQPLAELAGSLGDIGTLLPLMIALVINNSISLPATLLVTGSANILTGILFGIPLPVQPMKAIAAVAIAQKFTLEENAAAGLVVAALVGLFSITGLINWANRITPIPVIKGIQVGAGLSLCLSAGSSMFAPLRWNYPDWTDTLWWVVAAGVLLLASLIYPRMPYTIIILFVGFILGQFYPRGILDSPGSIPILHPSLDDFWKATTSASLGQLPLTLLNSVIAASALASDLLPSPPYPPAPSVYELGISVSIINLIGCWFGAMPVCHGSGGLAGQYRFGARSGASVIFLGTIKVLLGLLSFWQSDTIAEILNSIPRALLGVLILAAGVELAKVGESVNYDARDLRVLEDDAWDGKQIRALDERERSERFMVMLVTVASLITFKNDAVGFLVGLSWHWTMKFARKREERNLNSLSPGFLRRGSRIPSEHTSLLSHEESDQVA